MQHCELHLHTHYSLLDGLNTPEEYLARAAEIGMTHLAITDHGVLSGHREFQQAAKKHNITPILGCEMYISATDRFDRRAVKKRDDNTQAYNHITVLAQNATGLTNLNKLSELAWTEGFYSKPRIDMDALEEYNEGLIVTSGCITGLIPKAIENNLVTQAEQYAREFQRIFGERFFMEIQGHNETTMNHALMALASKFGVAPVVTSDCHYARKEDLWLEQAMLILSSNPKLNKEATFEKSRKMDFLERFNYLYPDRQMNFEKYEIFLRDYKTHHELLTRQGINDQPIKNTMIVAGMIEDYPYYEGLNLLPKPKGENPEAILRRKVKQGLKDRGLDKDQAAVDRANEELDIICAKDGFPVYFIIEANAVQWAKKQDIFIGPGRGSGAGSMVNYALGVTNVNPLDYNLLFFRFINPERNDFPDIDTDVEDTRRSEIKEYLRRQYKNVASIATFGTYQGKNAIKDASRVFQVPLKEVNAAIKGADWLKDWFEHWYKTEKGAAFKKKYPEVIKLAEHMHGRLKSQGMHAGGLVISNEPITNVAPMQSAKDNSDPSGNRIPLVALDMEAVAEIGLIKYDFLGLKALSIINQTVKTIKQRKNVDIDLEHLAMDDPKIYEQLSQGYTKGVFQCEAVPYTNTIIKMGGVANFDELAASNALVRPGAMKSTAGEDFIERKNGRKQIRYHHDDMEWFTKETYGAIIYQEQVMLTMTELAGMKMSTADKVRKIIGKKRDVKEFEQFKAEFIEGASKKVPTALAERLWHDFEAHAGYSFNKSHAVAYSMLSYWTAWLKYYYPVEFMAAVLKNEDDKDSRLDYLIEAKRMGLRIKLPHVNESGINFEIQTDAEGDFIRFGLANVKFISDKIAPRLIEHRPFESYSQLYDVVMTKGSGLSTRVLGSLNAVGGAVFPDHPRRGNERENFYEYLAIPAFETKALPPVVKAQMRTLDDYSETEAFVTVGMVRKIKTGPGWARVEVVDETGSAGIFTGEHTPIETGKMYVLLVSGNRIARYISIDDLMANKAPAFYNFLNAMSFPDVPEGMHKVVAFNSRTTKAGKKMAHVVLSDENKNLTAAMVFPQLFFKAHTRMPEGAVVDVKLAETDDGSLFVDNVL